MDFTKMHGAGNDFVVVQAASWREAGCLQKYAQWLCDRHFGIGADGLLVVGPEPGADIFMRVFNSDGSEPEMCGNGIRCVARFAYERSLVQSPRLSVRTGAGLRYPEIILKDDHISGVKVDMGEPGLERALIPVAGVGEVVDVDIKAPEFDFKATTVSMGNPHCVIFVDEISEVPVARWGPEIENHIMFPARTNVEFVQVVSPEEMIMRVWERGAGITLACGTGACATLVAGVISNRSHRSCLIHLLGGDLFIEWSKADNHVYMSGPAQEVFSGQVDLTRLKNDINR